MAPLDPLIVVPDNEKYCAYHGTDDVALFVVDGDNGDGDVAFSSGSNSYCPMLNALMTP
jgi:hypothetical protein